MLDPGSCLFSAIIARMDFSSGSCLRAPGWSTARPPGSQPAPRCGARILSPAPAIAPRSAPARSAPSSRRWSRRPAPPGPAPARPPEDSRFRGRPDDSRTQTLISSKPSRMSSLVSASPSMPQVRTVWRTSTASNQPQRRGRPVTTPNSRAALAERLADVVVHLVGRERPLANARGVGLADAEHVVDRVRAEAGAGRRLRRHRVGRGDVRISAVVDVEQRALRALEQNALALAPLGIEQRPDRIHVRQDLAARRRRDRRRPPAARSRPGHGRGAARCDAPAAARSWLERRQIGEIHEADGAAADFVLVSRADAALGGADAGGRVVGLAHGFELAMQRQDQRGVLGNAQIFRRHLDALFLRAGRSRRPAPADRPPRRCR